MERKLPLYIFIRNSVILCVLFVIISILIIEHRKQIRGEESLFNRKSNYETSELNIDKSQVELPRNYIIY